MTRDELIAVINAKQFGRLYWTDAEQRQHYLDPAFHSYRVHPSERWTTIARRAPKSSVPEFIIAQLPSSTELESAKLYYYSPRVMNYRIHTLFLYADDEPLKEAALIYTDWRELSSAIKRFLDGHPERSINLTRMGTESASV